MSLLLIILVIVLIFGGLPIAPWGGWHQYGYYPSGLGVLLFVVLLIVLFGGWR